MQNSDQKAAAGAAQVIPAASATMKSLDYTKPILIVESGILMREQQLDSQQLYALERSLRLRRFFAKAQHGKLQLPVLSLILLYRCTY